jgi:hypothetical protein
MAIGRRKDTLNPYALVHLLGEVGKLTPVHLLTGELTVASLQPCLLCRTGGHAEYHLILMLLYLKAYMYTPGEKSQCLYKSLQPLLSDSESRDQVLGCHP